MIELILMLTTTLAFSAMPKEMKICGQEFMPMQGTGPDKKMAGTYAEVLRKVCAKHKINCSFEVVPLARCLKMAEDGEVHIVSGIARIPEREAILRFPKFLTEVGYTFFVKKGTASKYTKLEDLKNMTVGIHGGSATAKNLAELNEKAGKILKLEEEAVAETLMRKLDGGRYGENAAVYCTRPVCMHQAKVENLELEPVSFNPKMQSHTVGFSKKAVDEETFETLKASLAEIMKTPEMKKIFEQANMPVHPDNK